VSYPFAWLLLGTALLLVPCVAIALAAGAAAAPLAELLGGVAALDRLGAPPEESWSGLPRDGPLGELARVAVRSADSGTKLAGGLERLAGEIRAERAGQAAVRAHRAAVFTVAPLAACFLPSFVCLGVIPVVIGVARQVLGGVGGAV
jgi:pilus assembly protein TadC